MMDAQPGAAEAGRAYDVTVGLAVVLDKRTGPKIPPRGRPGRGSANPHPCWGWQQRNAPRERHEPCKSLTATKSQAFPTDQSVSHHSRPCPELAPVSAWCPVYQKQGF